MTTYLVATVTRYVLVEAENEAQARELAMPALDELYADFRGRHGEFPIEIHTVREATRPRSTPGPGTSVSPKAANRHAWHPTPHVRHIGAFCSQGHG